MRNTSLLALVGCVHAPPAAPVRAGAVYDVAVVSATGDRTVTALYALEATPDGPRTWSMRTLHTAGAVEEAGATWSFDSATPTAGDPWPLLLQHAVATVPAAVRFDAHGAPEALADAEAWEGAARAAVDALGLPGEARAAADQLIDPAGLLADLRRTFPGAPPAAAWTRPEHLGAFDGVRDEACTEWAVDDVRTWTCAGTVTGPDVGALHLHDATSSTTVVADARGLVSHESAWSGTLLWRDGGEVRDAPVGGRRLVRRR